jgi:hypothetical protein
LQAQEKAIASHSNAKADAIIVPGQRESMESVYKAKAGRKPKLEHQGSNTFMGNMFKEVAKGRLGHFGLTKIVPYLDDPLLPTRKGKQQIPR